MTQTEAFKLLADVREAAEREGGVFRDDVFAMDNAPPSDPTGFAFLAAHTVTIKFAGGAVAGVFLEKARAMIQRLLDRSSVSITLDIGGAKPARLSLKAGIDKASAAIRNLEPPAADDGG